MKTTALISRRQWLGKTAGALCAAWLSPLVAAPAAPPRYFAISSQGGAGVSGADAAAALKTPFADYDSIFARLRAGDVVLFAPGYYRLTKPVRLVSGVSYRGVQGEQEVLLDGNHSTPCCMSGQGVSNVHIEHFHCVNAKFNGIEFEPDLQTGTLPADITIRDCDCSNNGTEARKQRRLFHEQGNGICLHSGRRAGVPVQGTTQGILVEDCRTHANAHAGILIDLPGTGHTIRRCQAGNNGTGMQTNAWGILMRSPGGVAAKGWQRTRHKNVWRLRAFRYRHQSPVGVVCARLKTNKSRAWRPVGWALQPTGNKPHRPGVGEYGFSHNAQGHCDVFVNLGDVRDFLPVITWIGHCTDPLIESCEVWSQGGKDGVGIGFDQGTHDGTIRNCQSRNNRRGYSLHINRNGSILASSAIDNTEFGFKIDRNLGTVNLGNNYSSGNGRAGYFLDTFSEPDGGAILIANTAHDSSQGYAFRHYAGRLTLGKQMEKNTYTGPGKSVTAEASQLPALEPKIQHITVP